METSDPDDVFTLCILATHPSVDLLSVTITPGTRDQVGVVRHILNSLDRSDVLVGSKNPDHPKQCVSEFHYKWLGKINAAEPDGIGGDILEQAYLKNNKVTIVCGASLGNISKFLDKGHTLDRIVVQGGFAGDSVVPEEHRLEKFKGKETCATFNLNGDVKAGLHVAETNLIKKKIFVSKNVCHGVVYDQAMHYRMLPDKNAYTGLSLLYLGMTRYLEYHPNGKAFHDPLAACVAIDESICTLAEVEVYRQKGEWGSILKPGSNTFISTNVERWKFEKVLTAYYSWKTRGDLEHE
jgi:pyrimidine-specific ribonucleoside hydrolase